MEEARRAIALCVFLGAASLLLVAPRVLGQRPGPDAPSERYAVLVHTTATEDEDPSDPYPMARVTDEVAKRIEDRRKWFILTDDPDRAEIVVDVVNHAFDEQVRTRIETRVDVTGTRKEWVDVSWVQEQHFLEARVHLPGGAQALVKGSDTRQKGGTLKHAAEELAKDLERLCRERYEDLESERRRLR